MKEEQDKREIASTLNKGISRRKFMSKGAMAAAGATIVTSGGFGIVSSLAQAATCATTPGTVKHPRGTWGWPTGGLDPAVAGERAYQKFFSLLCCGAVMDGVIGTLQDQLGSPYTNIDIMMFKFGGAGVNGWGTICGTALGATLASNIIVGIDGTTDRGSQISNDLMAYYSRTSMPVYTPVNSLYSSQGGTKPQFLPGGTFPTSTANSPLCHVSTNKWMTAANTACGLPTFVYGGTADPTSIVSSSIERKERCARLAGSMAYKCVELINAYKAGTYTSGAWGGPGVGNPGGSPAQPNCTDCHTA